MRVPPLSLAAFAAVLVGACATPGSLTCPAGQSAMVSETLYFGTAKPGGTVSAAQWQGFLDEIVTPRFPGGLSVLTAAGQWKSGTGSIVREDSYVLNIVHAHDIAAGAALDEIARSYKTRFHQEAVLRVRSTVCASF